MEKSGGCDGGSRDAGGNGRRTGSIGGDPVEKHQCGRRCHRG